MTKLVVLDRDGVINQDSEDYIKSPDECIPVPGSIAAIARLSNAGYKVVVATNQSGLARGYFDLETLQAIHDKIQRLVKSSGGYIDRFYYCPHGPDDDCLCRKPKPGLLQRIVCDYQVSPRDIPVVGDSIRDLEMALAMQAQPILVKTGNGMMTQQAIKSDTRLSTTPVFDDLGAFVNQLLKRQ